MPARTIRGPAIQSMSRYLYAVIGGGEEKSFGPIGIDGTTVYAIVQGELSAVVSDVPNEKVRPERRKLAAHHEVLKRLAQEHALLPMTFGIIAESPSTVRRLLSGNQARLAEQLRLVAGKIEMGLRVHWDVANIFEYFVARFPELRAFRDRLFRADGGPSQDERIELGRFFERLLTRSRQEYTERVLAFLRTSCADIKINDLRHEKEVMNLACLVGREAQKDFEQAVCAAAKGFDNHYAFDISGPWPPHHFVEVDLHK